MDAKEKVISWCRSKNPQTMDGVEWEFVNHGNYIEEADLDKQRIVCSFSNKDEKRSHELGEYICELHNNKILGSDMGLQELLIALQDEYMTGENGCDYSLMPPLKKDHVTIAFGQNEDNLVLFDLQKNLHEQSEEFYESILPLIPNE